MYRRVYGGGAQGADHPSITETLGSIERNRKAMEQKDDQMAKAIAESLGSGTSGGGASTNGPAHDA